MSCSDSGHINVKIGQKWKFNNRFGTSYKGQSFIIIEIDPDPSYYIKVKMIETGVERTFGSCIHRTAILIPEPIVYTISKSRFQLIED